MMATKNTSGTALTNHRMEQINAEILKWIRVKVEQTKREKQIIYKLRSVAI